MPTFIFFVAGIEKAKVVGANMGEITKNLTFLASGSAGSAGATGLNKFIR